MSFPENLGNNLAHFERIELETNFASVACLRPHWTGKLVFYARRIVAAYFAATLRASMTKASRLHSSTWVNSDTRGRGAKG
jgi:hypothetical protein